MHLINAIVEWNQKSVVLVQIPPGTFLFGFCMVFLKLCGLPTGTLASSQSYASQDMRVKLPVGSKLAMDVGQVMCMK